MKENHMPKPPVGKIRKLPQYVPLEHFKKLEKRNEELLELVRIGLKIAQDAGMEDGMDDVLKRFKKAIEKSERDL